MVRVFHVVLVGLVLGLGGLVVSEPGPIEGHDGSQKRETSGSLCGLGWLAPVDAEVVDRFRAPEHRYGPGNRGLEYRTTHGQEVAAVADGRVVFAGPVGGRSLVVVMHDDGIRSTYVGLHDVRVSSGDEVDAGSIVALATEGFHLTARHGEVYLDPEPLLGQGCFVVRLVPLPEESP